MLPLVSIIIVNWNGLEVFRVCLKSLEKLMYPNWELIVVDNGSTDGSTNLAEEFKLTAKRYFLIKNKSNLGFAEANNQGFVKSTGEYVLLLNNDTKITVGFLTQMVERMEQDGTIGVMQPKIYLMDQKDLLDNAGSYLTNTGFLQHWGFMQKDSNKFETECDIFSAKGACLLARRKLIERVGLFDSDFGSYFEESDFCWRVWLIGFRVVFYPRAHIYHKLGATSKKMNQIFVNFHSFKNRILSLTKNLNTVHLLTILIPHLVIVLSLGLYYTLKLEFKKSWMIFSSVLWNILHLRNTLKKRKKVQSYRKVSDQEVFNQVMEEVNLKEMFAHFKRVEANF